VEEKREERAVSRSEFARELGVKPSYVTQLGKDDRLVLDAVGRVLVEASKARIRDTKDPAKAAVAARHAEARAAAQEGAEDAPGDAPDAPLHDGDRAYQDWRTRTERAKALAAERDLAQSMGQLLSRDDVRSVVADAFTQARKSLEGLPSQLAPELAALSDEIGIRTRLADEVESVLHELSRSLSALGGSDAAG
jgi:hypothetical protein